jgi:diguanylate cyclase (GGDEF)-like protein/PAS domain S-box-containing protein
MTPPWASKLSRLTKSLRFQLLLVSLLVEGIMLTLLVFNNLRVMEQAILTQARDRVAQMSPVLNAALGVPLLQRDFASLAELLSDFRNERGLTYLVLQDHRGRVVAAEGWPADKPLPKKDQSIRFDNGDLRFDSSIPISVARENYGELYFGQSTALLTLARNSALRQGVLIALAEIGISALLLGLLGYWLTRNLGLLIAAANNISKGKFDVVLPARGHDEIGRLAMAFNAMTANLRDRIGQLADERARFHAIADYTVGWESWIDPGGQLLWVNPSVEQITGYSPGECMAMTNYPVELVVAEDMQRVAGALGNALKGERSNQFEFRIRRKDGEVTWISAAWQPIEAADGKSVGIRASMADVTQRKTAEAALFKAMADLRESDETQRRYLARSQDEQARLSALLNAMNIGIMFVGEDERILYYNRALLRIWQIPESVPIVGRPALQALSECSGALSKRDHFSSFLLQVKDTHEISDTTEIKLADDRLLTQTSHPVRSIEGRVMGRLWIYEDVTHERQTAQQLVYLAERDSLTGLFNRRRFQDELTRMVNDTQRHASKGALLFFDLDEFKYINDTFGHRVGDSILIRIAGEIATIVRRNEVFGRLGGDEFAILIPVLESEEQVHHLAERVVRAVAQIPFKVEGENLRLTTSVGVAIYPDDAGSSDELVAHADAAMYQAKQAGKNAWRRYHPDQQTGREMLKRLNWNERIEQALEHGRFQLHYQGVYHTNDRTPSHVEALVRMVDPDHPEQLIMPGHFIPYAEKSGKIVDVDRWVIRQAIAQLAKSPRLKALAVNISGRSFDEPSMPMYIANLLREYHVEPYRLLVELTETSALSDLGDAAHFIEALHQTGCRICLDDFGTGFSSFAYLKHLRADILKIDGLFIRNLQNDHDDQIFVKAIADVARGLGKITVAEFVENEETLNMLRSFGVDMVQGYHLDKPVADHPWLV